MDECLALVVAAGRGTRLKGERPKQYLPLGYSTMLIPVAQGIGFSTAAVAVLVGSTSVGVIFPWSGATVATAFSFGEISLKDLIRVGVLAQIIMIATASTYALLLGRLL